jgi:uncharacterized Zn finger protein (UPF0148 family)
MSVLLTCPKCNTPLTGLVIDDMTTCPSCGKRWRLTIDHKEVMTTYLEVNPTKHGSKTVIQGDKRNG